MGTGPATQSTAPPTSDPRSVVRLLVLLFFLLAFGYQAAQSAAYALFVQRFGADKLPLAVLVMPLATIGLTYVNMALTRRFPPLRVLAGACLVIVASALAMRWGVGAAVTALMFLLPAVDAATSALNNMIVWGSAGQLLDLQSAKRFSPFIGAGRSAGMVVCGVLTGPLVALMGTPNLYFVEVVCMLLAAGVMALIIGRSGMSATAAAPATRRTAPTQEEPDDPETKPFILALFVAVLASMAAYTIVRNLLLVRGASVYPDVNDYASKLGLVSSFHGGATLLMSLFVSRRFLARFGVRGALIVFPLGFLAVYAPMTWLGFTGGGDWALFLFASAGYVVGGPLVYGLRTPAIQVLYKSLPPQRRTRVVSLFDGVVEPLAVGLAAAVIVVELWLSPSSPGWVSGAVIVFLTVFAGVSSVLVRRYRLVLARRIGRSALAGGSLDEIVDSTTADVVADALAAASANDIITRLSFLDRDGAAELAQRLVDHEEADVRRVAIGHLSATHVETHRDLLVERATSDPSPQVRAEALARLGDQGTADVWHQAFEDPDPTVVRVAISGSLTGQRPSEIRAEASQRLRLLATSTDASRRELAASIALDVARSLRDATGDDSGRQTVADVADRLAGDEHPTIASSAFTARCWLGKPDAIATAVGQLGSWRTARAGAANVTACGSAALDLLRQMLLDPQTEVRPGLRALRLVRALGGEGATELLRDVIESGPRSLRPAALEAAVKAGLKIDAATMVRWLEREHTESSAHREALDALGTITEPGAPVVTLGRLLEERLHDTVGDATAILECGPDGDSMRRLAQRLHQGGMEQAYAFELIESTLDGPTRRLLAAVLADCGIGTAPHRRATSVSAELALERLTQHPTAAIAGLAQQALSADDSAALEEETMKLFDRLIVLKSVPPFDALDADLLVSVARLVTEVQLEPDEVLFEAGEPGDSMFVVVEGTLRVHAGAQTIGTVSAGETIGELALLDGAERSASVTATSAALLFQLDAEPFFELLSEQPQVLRAMVSTVTRRLRHRSDDVLELRNQLAAEPAS